ncbi:hypothetical protein EUX98_g674 [Antrodiella citrinella]|uniref:Arrestin C-terminal-like domain-containing protein n=1 Tax=Antrodiella citrinella TaxID=2447956 RepID=A0A4S4N6J9_9APHY|nr:hypothetical protein EUX98_g674 [Antrodiella citrinella]
MSHCAEGKRGRRSNHDKASGVESYRTTPRPVLSVPPSRTSSTSSSTSGTSSTHSYISECDIGFRSLKGMEGLKMAEHGDAMVEFDVSGDNSGMGSRFLEGNRFVLDPMTPGGGAIARTRPAYPTTQSGPGTVPPELSAEVSLSTHDTLLNIGRSHSHNAAELKALLGNSNARLKSNAVVLRPIDERSGGRKQKKSQAVCLEQAKPRARVEIDIVLESNTLVQGGYLRGCIKVRVRKRGKKEAPIFLTEGKLRVVGFESLPNDDNTYTFYQCSAPLSSVTDASRGLYDEPLGPDGFAQAVEGVHVLPFAMELPLDSSFGNAKGALSLSSGVNVRYVVMASLKVRDSGSGKRSIAHFYRNCEIWPSLDPSSILSVAPRPLQASTAKSFSLLSSQDQKARLSAQLHRLHWIAGQRCHVKILVHNGTHKPVKSCTLTLVRTTTLFKPKPALDAGGGNLLNSDPDACQTSTAHKAVGESTLELGQRSTKGYASAKGWWTGVKPGQELEFSHFLLLPTDALSVTRGRLLEVEYSIRVSISAGHLSSDVFVTLPVRIVNFISIDPPPTAALLSNNGAYFRSVQTQSSSSGADRWGTVNSDVTSGVMHVQDGPPPPTSLSDQSLFSEESSVSSSMQSLVPLALRAPHTKLRVANPDRSRAELTRVLSEASVYSTDSACVEPSSSSSGSAFGSIDSVADRDRTLTRKGRSARPMDLANLPLGSDDPSDVDVVLKTVLGDLRRGDNESCPRNISSADEDDEDGFYDDPSEDSGFGVTSAREGPEDVGYTSFKSRVQQKLAAAHNRGQGSAHTSDNSFDQDEEQTPRVGYDYTRRSNHIQIPSILRAGPPGGSGPAQDRKPPVPPRNIKRPRSIHASGGRPHGRSSLRGPRGQHEQTTIPRPTSSDSTGSSSDAYTSPVYTKNQRSSRSSRPSLDRGDSDTSVMIRIASLEARVRKNGTT